MAELEKESQAVIDSGYYDLSDLVFHQYTLQLIENLLSQIESEQNSS